MKGINILQFKVCNLLGSFSSKFQNIQLSISFKIKEQSILSIQKDQ